MSSGVVVPLAGILMPLVLSISIVRMKHRQNQHQWQHQERLRALELGVALPESEPQLGSGAVLAIGAGVPIASALAASMASIYVPYNSNEYVPALAISWGCAVLISTVALITSLVLGIMLVRSRAATQPAESMLAKPAFEPDAFDADR